MRDREHIFTLPRRADETRKAYFIIEERFSDARAPKKKIGMAVFLGLCLLNELQIMKVQN